MEYKPGVKTSELYVTLAAAIVGLLVVYGELTSDQAAAWLAVAGALIAVLPVAVYTIARTWYKAKAEFDK
jgi:urea transporter